MDWKGKPLWQEKLCFELPWLAEAMTYSVKSAIMYEQGVQQNLTSKFPTWRKNFLPRKTNGFIVKAIPIGNLVSPQI